MVEAIQNASYQPLHVLSSRYVEKNDSDESIFLEEKLQEVKDEQGFIGKMWNGFKEFTNLGQSSSDCDSMLEKYKNGQISFEEAVKYIDEFDKKQNSMTNLFANIATGTGAIALATVAVASGPIGWGAAFMYGAPIGAALKTGIKAADRATNNVEGDALNAKSMAKDAISGAITGATSAVSSGIMAGVKEGKLALSLANGAKCGAQCGAMSGASTYIVDTALDKDKEFNFGDFAKTTLTSSAVSAGVGAAVGGTVYGVSGGNAPTLTLGSTIARDSSLSASRKIAGNGVKEAMNLV
ncbi:MAG: hypothetical protein IJD57_03925 [Candidatus Gastranaerophilales bacterium]|nr:hypothetical protein [Candidatus Gastranaerophilales bacterium]